MKHIVMSLAMLATACGNPKSFEKNATTHDVHDGSSGDITVLRSFNTHRTVTHANNNGPGDVRIDLSACLPRSSGIAIGASLHLDCSEAAQLALAAQAADIQGPIAGELLVTAQADQGYLRAPSFFCTFQEIQTLTREAAFATATGIGFSYNGTVRTVPRHALVQVGRATGRNGEAMLIHRFQAPAYCWAGSTTSSARATYSFKPYLEFRGSFGDLYRNWDSVPQNYVVSYSGSQGFDRSGELLR